MAEARPSAHGFDVLLGWPAGPRGRGGKSVIVTRPLAAYLESRRYPARGIVLPIGRTAIKRLRRILGHTWLSDHDAWWEERIADLSDLTLEQFAARHGVGASSVINARLALLGPVLRPAGWWRAPDVADVLLRLPTALAAEQIGISAGSARRLRHQIRQEQPA